MKRPLGLWPITTPNNKTLRNRRHRRWLRGFDVLINNLDEMLLPDLAKELVLINNLDEMLLPDLAKEFGQWSASDPITT